MKLLSKTELETEKSRQRDQKVREKYQLESQITLNIKHLNEVKDKRDQELMKLHPEHTEKLQELKDRLLTLHSEVTFYEERRKKALQPIDSLRIQAEKLLSEAIDKEKSNTTFQGRVQAKDQELRSRTAQIERKERETEEAREEARLIEAKAIKLLDYNKEESERITQERTKLYSEVKKEKDSLYEIKKRATDKERTLDLLIIENSKRSDQIAADRIHLESQQATLKLAYEEARRKGII